MYLHSTRHLHAAHSVGETMRPEGGHVILLDLHLVALEVTQLKQTDLVLHAVLYGRHRERGFVERFPCFIFALES